METNTEEKETATLQVVANDALSLITKAEIVQYAARSACVKPLPTLNVPNFCEHKTIAPSVPLGIRFSLRVQDVSAFTLPSSQRISVASSVIQSTHLRR